MTFAQRTMKYLHSNRSIFILGLDDFFSNRFNALTLAEELASLVKDNLPCKNLILSVEDMLVNFLEDDTSLDEVLELEPMNSYHRMFVHRLAEIFGFSHHSVGEEEDRHLVLERSPETSIPDILVSDLLSECGEMHYVLRRKEDFPGQKVGVVSAPSLDESETSDSEDACSCKQLVHELTSLIKKKLPCKNLILSLEDMLINYLQDDTSLDGVLELEPMNSYHRMLVHQLAEIFRFSHYSVGEGGDRHVVLERRPKTSIPDFLVGAYLPPMTYDVLRRKVVFPDMGTKHELTSSDTKEFGQTAVEEVKIEYTDEKNIHSSNKTEIDFLSGKNPWACAVSEVNKSGESELGDVKIESMDERNIHSSKTEIDFLSGENPWACTVSKVNKSGESEVGDVKIEYTDEGNIHSSNKKKIDFLSLKNPSACAISEVNKSGEIEVGDGSSKEPEQKDLQEGDSSAEMKSGTGDEYLKQEHRGGAKRLFGNAFGMHEGDINLSKKTEVWQPENSSAGFDKPASVEVQDLLGRMSYK